MDPQHSTGGSRPVELLRCNHVTFHKKRRKTRVGELCAQKKEARVPEDSPQVLKLNPEKQNIYLARFQKRYEPMAPSDLHFPLSEMECL